MSEDDMRDRFELEIAAELENLARIADFIGDAMREFGLDGQQVFEVQLAVDEACTNIIDYGFADTDAVGVIEILCSRRAGEVEIVIKDNGKPFDPASVQPPDLDANLEERKVGGLGIYFMKTVMDKISYESKAGKNVLTMITKLQ